MPGERRGGMHVNGRVGGSTSFLDVPTQGPGQHQGYWIFLVLGSYLDTMTVQAPQPPPPQPYFVPVRWTGRKGVKEKRAQAPSLLVLFFPLDADNK